MANYFVKQLKGSDLGWWTEAENLGKNGGSHQRAVNLNQNVYDLMFPGKGLTTFQINVSYRDGDTGAILTDQRPVQKQAKNMRLAGAKVPGQYYGVLEPDDYMVIKVDGLELTYSVVMKAEKPEMHDALSQLMNGNQMEQLVGANENSLLELMRTHDAELFGLGRVRPLKAVGTPLPAQTAVEEQQWEDALGNMSETEYQAWVAQFAGAATGLLKKQLANVRQASRRVTDGLKARYNHRCQICGDSTVQLYGIPVVEAHHIEPFILNQNHQAGNILILCPNHHRVWHAAGGSLDLTTLQVIYANGHTESLKLHQAGHLVPGNARN